VSNLSLVPVPAEQSPATCANCGAPLVADQRYCLSCGQPVSPVRLAFLDVLQNDQQRQARSAQNVWGAPIDVGPPGYLPGGRGAGGWLERHSGLLALASVLLLCLVAGLLVGHWVTQSGTKTPAQQVLKVEGLGGLGSSAPTTTAPTTSTSEEPALPKTSSKTEKKEAEEGAKETAAEKAPPPAPKKISKSKLQKLGSSKGKKHTEEINELGDQPIETG
jgi:hypothetical protein